MRTVYGAVRSNAKFRRFMRGFVAGLFIGLVFLALNTSLLGPNPFFCISVYLGFAIGILLVITIVKRWREVREREQDVVVEDKGVIAHGNYLLWDEIKELREDPWEGYQLVFRPLNKRGEPLHFVTIDDFPHFDNFVEQLREHGVEIKINRW